MRSIIRALNSFQRHGGQKPCSRYSLAGRFSAARWPWEGWSRQPASRPPATIAESLEHRIDQAAAAPVLRIHDLDKPVKIASMELLRNGRNFLVRVRTTDGAEGIGVPNAMHLIHTYPIFLNRVAPSSSARTPASSSPCSGSSTATTTTTSTRAWPSGSAWRPPSSRSSTCSAS